MVELRMTDTVRRDFHRLHWLLAFGLSAPSFSQKPSRLGIQSRSSFDIDLPHREQSRARTDSGYSECPQWQLGDELVQVALKQARFWRSRSYSKAKESPLASSKNIRGAGATFLANAFNKEAWHAERCALLRKVEAGTTFWPSLEFKLADCEEDLKFYPAAETRYRRVLDALPNSMAALQNLHWLTQGNDRFAQAEDYARRMTVGWPQSAVGWSRLGETLRRKRQPRQAREAFQALVRLNPMSPQGYGKLAALAIQEGETKEAVTEWRNALLANPDNEKIANRLAWLAPAKEGEWVVDVPSLAQINQIIAERDTVKAAAGADLAYLLDDEVTYLNPDGSTSNVVTMVAHAINQSGRDR